MGIDGTRVQAYPHELSGGMRQRVVIAMAIALNPELVLLDEPTTALDVIVQREIMQQIGSCSGELGFAVLFITHDLSLLVEFSDRIAIMYAGDIIEEAEAQEIFTHPDHPYTKGLMSSFPSVSGDRAAMTGILGPPDLRHPPLGLPFPSTLPDASDSGVCAEVLRIRSPAARAVRRHATSPEEMTRLPTTPGRPCSRLARCNEHVHRQELLGRGCPMLRGRRSRSLVAAR